MDLVPCATGEVWDLNRGVAVLHLPTVALPNATFGYSKSSELSRIRHGAATELPRSGLGAATGIR